MKMIKLLLDFDGVIIKNKKIIRYQYQRSAKFVQKHLHVPISTADNLNRKYFPKYGHTVIMLNEHFQIPVTLEEYNDYVFPKQQIYRLDSLIDKKTFEHGNDFAKHFKSKDYQTSIFTNAHVNWVTTFADIFDLPIEEHNIIWPQSLDLLKPMPKAYDNVSDFFKEADRIIFVDDSEQNIEYPSRLQKWQTYHFKPKDTSNTLNQILNV